MALPLAALPFLGELLRWEVRYLGVVGGTASAEVLAGPDGTLQLRGAADTAPWYARVYTLHDTVESTWDLATGSRRYETHFREGGFLEDQRWAFDPTGVEVWRRHYKDGAWQESQRRRPCPHPVEDPVSAFYRIRIAPGPGPWEIPVFSGKTAWTLTVRPLGPAHLDESALGPIDAIDYSLSTAHQGDLEQKGRLVLTLSDDADRVPLRLVATTNLGAIRADLIARRPPG